MYNTCILIYVYSMKKVQMLHMCVCIQAFIHTCVLNVFEFMFNLLNNQARFTYNTHE